MSKVIVAGSVITDMSVSVDKHPAVGETIIGNTLSYSPGGKGANQAVSAARLGADTTMICKVANDVNGNMSLSFLKDEGIHIKRTGFSQKPTGIAMIVVSEKTGNNNIVVVLGANEDLNRADINEAKIEKDDILVAQFETPLEVTKYFFAKGREVGSTNILNPAPANKVDKELMELTDVVIMNETELNLVSFYYVRNPGLYDEDTQLALLRLAAEYGNKVYIATLGDKGVIALFNNKFIRVAPIKVNAIDTTGAGDCFVGAFAAFLSRNNEAESLEQALKFANQAASISVTRKGSGVSMPNLTEVAEELLF
jgi:ribokinase